VVKSTNPSFIGNDTWGNIGEQPIFPVKIESIIDEDGNEVEGENEESFEQRVKEYQNNMIEFNRKLEEQRQKFDRIAFCGQVPVNVTGTNVGDYIVANEYDNKIIGTAISENDLTFNDYKKCVGRVVKILEDGRAFIIVKIS
jgi:hypothetical protein